MNKTIKRQTLMLAMLSGILFFFASCKKEEIKSVSDPNSDKSELVFAVTELDYVLTAAKEDITSEGGVKKIKKGSNPLRVFTFKNNTANPIIIANAQSSCGCLVPTYPKEPVMPGQSGRIEVRYDTQRVGPFTKSVTLSTNEVNPVRVLTVKGDVAN